MRILITGVSGFVGRHLEKLLKSSGYEVFQLVRNAKGNGNEFLWDFKSNLPAKVPICDVLIHLAACVDFSTNLNIAQYDANTISTLKLAAYAQKYNAYFILASMAGIHGTKYPLIDDKTPIDPENHYAVSKYLAEEAVKTFVDNSSILRIGGIYGLNGPDHLGLNKAINNAIYKKSPPVLKGSGKAKRNYICVLDAARWIFYLLEKYGTDTASRENKIRETLYLAGHETMTIEEYLQTIVNVVLPNMGIMRTEGNDGNDLIVNASSPPFNLQTFKEYLNSLC